MTKSIRVNLTFEIEEETRADGRITQVQEIKDQLDDLLIKNFTEEFGIKDWNVRWVSDLADSPLFGSASEAVPTPEAMSNFLQGDDDALNEASLLATNN